MNTEKIFGNNGSVLTYRQRPLLTLRLLVPYRPFDCLGCLDEPASVFDCTGKYTNRDDMEFVRNRRLMRVIKANLTDSATIFIAGNISKPNI